MTANSQETPENAVELTETEDIEKHVQDIIDKFPPTTGPGYETPIHLSQLNFKLKHLDKIQDSLQAKGIWMRLYWDYKDNLMGYVFGYKVAVDGCLWSETRPNDTSRLVFLLGCIVAVLMYMYQRYLVSTLN
jgi:hypothetical protein